MALVLLMASVPTAVAEEGPTKDISRLSPNELVGPSPYIRKMLSGRSWLITSGLDPVLGIGLSGRKDIAPSSVLPQDFSQFTFQTEPAIAVDPKDPDHLLVGLIDYNFPGMVTYNSIDGGATWEGPQQAKFPRQDLAAAGDPIVAFDRNGTAYYAFITLDIEEFTIGPLLGSAVVSAISLNRSPDGPG